MYVDRDTSAVINNSDGIVNVDRDGNLAAIPSQRFIDRIIDNLIQELQEPLFDLHQRFDRRPSDVVTYVRFEQIENPFARRRSVGDEVDFDALD